MPFSADTIYYQKDSLCFTGATPQLRFPSIIHAQKQILFKICVKTKESQEDKKNPNK